MATPGRAGFGALQAAQSRYATFSLACWSALIVWALSVAGRRGVSWLRPGFAWLSVAACCAALPVHLFIGVVWRLKSDNIAASGLAVTSGVHDDAWVATLHPITSIVYDGAARLRALGDPVVVDARLGAALADPAGLTSCQATLTLERVAHDGWRLTGVLAEDAAAGLIADRQGVVRGLARPAPVVDVPTPPEPEFVRRAWALVRGQRDRRRWLGFVAEGAGPPYTFSARSPDGGPLCVITLPGSQDTLP